MFGTARFCPECQREGERSSVYIKDRSRTCMGICPAYWDEDGRYHPPVDPNKTTTRFACSRGHSWSETD